MHHPSSHDKKGDTIHKAETIKLPMCIIEPRNLNYYKSIEIVLISSA